MIWALIYLVLLFVMVSSAILAGMRKDEANLSAERGKFFENRDEMERIKVSM